MKEYSTLSRSLKLEPRHHLPFLLCYGDIQKKSDHFKINDNRHYELCHYCCKTLSRPPESKSCISHSANTLEKGMNPTRLPWALGRQTRLFDLGMATSLGEGKLWIQTSYTSLKNWPCVATWLWWKVSLFAFSFSFV